MVLGAAAGMFLFHPAKSGRSIRTVINAPEKTSLNLTSDTAGPPVLSPDGTSIAFAASGADGKTALWVRPMNMVEAHILPGTEGAIFPFWSPDSHAVGFFSNSKLKTIDLDGGSPQVVADAQLGRGGAWGADGVIVFSANPISPLLRVNANGGQPVAVTKIDVTQHTSHRWPFFLPDGKHFLYLALHHDPSKAANNTLYYASIDGHENRPLFRSQSNAVYADGYLLFARGDVLMAQRFDPSSGKLSDEPRTLAKGVMNDFATWHMDASASSDGLLVFGSGSIADLQLVWMDRSGKQISTIAEKFTNLQFAQISPQGDRVALQIDAGVNDIWVLDLARGVRTRLTFGPVANIFPVWSPDGKWIAYNSNRMGQYGLYRRPSNGSGAEELLLNQEQPVIASSWSADGKYLIYSKQFQDGSYQIWALPLDGERKPYLVLKGGIQGHLSPDGHWLAYMSGESGLLEVYVVAFGGGQGKWQVSSNGGNLPQWSRDGKELHYMDPTYNLVAPPGGRRAAPNTRPPHRLSPPWSPPSFSTFFPRRKEKIFNKTRFRSWSANPLR